MKSITVISSSLLALLAASVLAGCSPEAATLTIKPEAKPLPVPTPYAMPTPYAAPTPYEAPTPYPTPTPWPAATPHAAPTPYPAPAPEVQMPRPNYAPVAAQKFDWVYEDGGQRQLQSKPQVDILFVVDNSDSMRTAQTNLVNNIDKFSSAISGNQMIDYHIGVISVWDYSPEFKPEQYGIGELRMVKGSRGPAQRFVTRGESAAVLKSTLSIGVKALKDGGPQHEEIYAPLAAALEKSGNGAPNDGFFRPEAQLVVIFLTDADEQPDDKAAPGGNRYTNADMFEKLVSFKGGDKSKISAYGVLVPTNAPDEKKDYILRITPKDHPECFDVVQGKAPVLNGNCPKSFGPEKLENFILKVNSSAGTTQNVRATYIKDITGNFGNDLKAIGEGIKKKTMAKVIYLHSRPMSVNFKPDVEVWFGTPEDVETGKAQLIPYGRGGWLYDVRQNAIVLSGDVDYRAKENARYIVRMHVAALQ